MRFWIAKNSEIPVREQLTTQIILAIVSGDLKVNQKLPSTREVARRLRIHFNTVNTVYRDLMERSWLGFRQGSGFYVLERLPNIDTNLQLDQLIVSFLKQIRSQGFTLSDLQKQLPKWLEVQPPDHFLVLDSDKTFRKILAAEIRTATGFPTRDISVEECSNSVLLNGAIPLAMYGRVDKAKVSLPINLKLLNSHSVQQDLQKYNIPNDINLVVVSYWPDLLRWARALLTAAGIDSANFSLRDAGEENWEVGITNAKTFVIADSLVAKELPLTCRHLVFNLIAENSLAELKEMVTELI